MQVLSDKIVPSYRIPIHPVFFINYLLCFIDFQQLCKCCTQSSVVKISNMYKNIYKVAFQLKCSCVFTRYPYFHHYTNIIYTKKQLHTKKNNIYFRKDFNLFLKVLARTEMNDRA